MVFPSIPVYNLDPPNWQQQQQQQQPSHHHFIGNGQQLGGQLPPLPPPTLPGGSTRPGSLADRARASKVPLPEPGLKCPRCESTNTKFCYYNNYSLTQPRHFCKTCRRYWTRGGALRNVPVGGGCRRNKRSKSRSGSKPPATTVAVSGSVTATGGGSVPVPVTGASIPPPLSFMGGSTDYGEMGGELGQSSGSSGFLLGEQWRMQQLPYLANFGAPSSSSLLSSCGLFQFEGGESMNNNNGINLSRHLVNLPGNNYDNQLSAGWSHDVSGFMSSITSTTTTTDHHL